MNYTEYLIAKQKKSQVSKLVTINRYQVSTNKPAIAMLTIKTSDDTLKNKIFEIYERAKRDFYFSSPFHHIDSTSETELVVEIRSALPMYKWMEFFIERIKYNIGYNNVNVFGRWEKYDQY